jgi:NitT/TauT family transport system permease protein
VKLATTRDRPAAAIPPERPAVRGAPVSPRTPPPPGRHAATRWRRWLPALLSLVVLALLVALWHWATTTHRVSRFVMPEPADTARALWRGLVTDGSYRRALWVTGQEIALGFGIGAAAGMTLAALLATSRLAERVAYPYIVFLQALPKVAIAPLLIISLGFGMKSKIVLIAMLVAFPVLVNTLEGLKATPQSRIDLLRTYGANRRQIFAQLRLPTAAPYIFAGLDIGIVFSPVGAVVAEFVGATEGLGVSVQQAQFNLDTAGLWALLIVLGALGITLHGVLLLVRRRVVFWERFERQSTTAAASRPSRARRAADAPVSREGAP